MSSLEEAIKSVCDIDPTDFHPEPKLDVLLRIHRGNDGFIRFIKGRGNDKKPIRTIGKEWHGLLSGSVRASDLPDMFPSIRDELMKDAFYTINSMFRPDTHKTADLRYLNSCYADLDHAHAMTFGQASGRILDLADQGAIPPPSYIVRSGNGSWAFWLLQDENDPEKPQRAWPEKIDLYRRIEKEGIHHAILRHAPGLCPDARALDASRVTRVEGSLHSGALRTVKYVPFLDSAGNPFAVTVERTTQVFGQDEDQLAVPHRLDDLVDDEAAKYLGPLLLAGGADTAELARESHRQFEAADTAPDLGETRGENPAAQILVQRAASPVGQRTVLVEELFIVAVTEQLCGRTKL